MCSAKYTCVLLVSTPEEDTNFSSSSTDDTTPTSDSQQYSFLLGVAHVAMDGVGTHISSQQVVELLGGLSLPTGGMRTNKELFQLLEHEWELRYRGKWVVKVIPPSVEERAPPHDAPYARADFLEDQGRYIVRSKYLRPTILFFLHVKPFLREGMLFLASRLKPATPSPTIHSLPLKRQCSF